jgi:hypothetical protein
MLQPERQGNSQSWKSTILSSERELKLLIEDSPSLKQELIKVYADAYEDAREEAAIETELNIEDFPKKCPWKIDEILPTLKKKI